MLYGLGRHAGYKAAAEGAFPTIKISGCLLAVAAPINKTLGLTGIDDPKVREAYRLCGFEPPPLAGDTANTPTVKPPTHAARVKPVARKRKPKPRLKNTRKGETAAVAS